METQLAKYLSDRMPGVVDMAISGLLRIPGGASRETWMFDASWTEGGAQKQWSFVVRKDLPASLLDTERETEYAFYSAYENSKVPVPRMRWLESDPLHLGTPFFIMDRILGCETSYRVLLSPEWAGLKESIAREMYTVLADIHALDWRGTPIATAVPIPAPEDCWKRELDHWEGIINDNEMVPQPIARAAIRWLRDNPPPPPKRVTVVHADYRVGNFLFDRSGIKGVVDWEMAHLGDPLEDLSWSFMEAWEWARDGLKGGIITEEAAIKAYEEAAGEPVDRAALHWWDVFSGVKAQGIWLTGAKSYQEARSAELIHAFTAYWLTNFQDEIILRTMGRGA